MRRLSLVGRVVVLASAVAMVVVLVVAATLMTAAVVAFGGLIGFVGLVVPHALRLLGFQILIGAPLLFQLTFSTAAPRSSPARR